MRTVVDPNEPPAYPLGLRDANGERSMATGRAALEEHGDLYQRASLTMKSMALLLFRDMDAARGRFAVRPFCSNEHACAEQCACAQHGKTLDYSTCAPVIEVGGAPDAPAVRASDPGAPRPRTGRGTRRSVR